MLERETSRARASCDDTLVRQIPTALESPNVRDAYIAGASVSNTPDSPAAWAVVLRWPGARFKPFVLSARVPIYDLHMPWMYPTEPEDPRPVTQLYPATVDSELPAKHPLDRTLERYPGTVIGAEWIACLYALRFMRRLREPAPGALWEIPRVFGFPPPALHDALPLLLHTTSHEIADFLEGRSPIARRSWLRRVQEHIAEIAEGKLVRRRGEPRPFFAPTDRPWIPSDPTNPFGVLFRDHGLPVYVRVIRPTENRKAAAAAEQGLADEQAPIYTVW